MDPVVEQVVLTAPAKLTLSLRVTGVRGGTAGVLPGSVLAWRDVPVTPDLLGGPSSLMIANLIENQVLQARDWPLAAALSMLLIMLVLLATGLVHRATADKVAVLR